MNTFEILSFIATALILFALVSGKINGDKIYHISNLPSHQKGGYLFLGIAHSISYFGGIGMAIVLIILLFFKALFLSG